MPRSPLVYRPQDDSHLLMDALRFSGRAAGARAADLCTGTGVVALESACLGASSVVAADLSPYAVRVAERVCRQAPCPVDVIRADVRGLRQRGPFDLVTCNPPYLPAPDQPLADDHYGPRCAWDAGPDGRAVIDQLCAHAGELLTPGGTLLLVQSHLADVEETLRRLRIRGLVADVELTKVIPYGPVLTARTDWLERTGRARTGTRTEELSVIRADRPRHTASSGHR